MSNIFISWFKRKDIFYVFNKLKYISREFRNLNKDKQFEKFDVNTWKRYWVGIVLFFIEFFVKLSFFIKFLKMSPTYGLKYFYLKVTYGELVAFCYVLVQNNIYFALVFIYMCVNMLCERLKEILDKIKLIDHYFSYQEHNNSLKFDILKIAKLEHELINFIKKFKYIYQFPLLVQLIDIVRTIITLVFVICRDYLVVRMEPYQKHLIFNIINFTILLVIKFSHIFLLCNIGELLVKSFKELRRLSHDIIICSSRKSNELLIREYIRKNVSENKCDLKDNITKVLLCFSVYGLFNLQNHYFMYLTNVVVFGNLVFTIETVYSLVY